MIKPAHACLAGLVLLAIPALAAAQSDQTDPWEQMRFRTGPIAWTPTVQLKNLGWDTNVFNEVTDPKKDFTATLAPQVDWWFRAGRSRLHVTNIIDLVYFATYSQERSVNQFHQATFELPLNRITPRLGGSYLDTRDRPGFEIDARAAHTETTGHGGVAVRIGPKTTVDVGARYTRYVFDGEERFLGSNLADILNRSAGYGVLTTRYRLTPLTTLTLLAEAGKESFSTSPDRDNRSFRIMPGVEFDPFALLKGSARLGVRRLDMQSAQIPDFQGLVASVNLAYVLMGRTRFTVAVDRDIQFSFETQQPYYLLTGVGLTVRHTFGRGWDVEARGNRQALAYETSPGATGVTIGRVDHVDTLGGGIGYTLSQGSRLGVNVDYLRRRSPVYARAYEGLRGGLAVTYGF